MSIFKLDHILRGTLGEPIGRVVMRDDSTLVVGEDIQVALLKVPSVFCMEPRGMKVFIDGVPYQVPSNIPDLKVNRRRDDLVVSSFILKCLQKP